MYEWPMQNCTAGSTGCLNAFSNIVVKAAHHDNPKPGFNKRIEHFRADVAELMHYMALRASEISDCIHCYGTMAKETGENFGLKS